MLRPQSVPETDFEDYPADPDVDTASVPPPVRSEEQGYRDDSRLRELVTENARRLAEALRLYEPTPLQEKFHASRARERVIRGGNRSGKSVAAAVEVARALTGQDPHGKYPPRNGVFAAVGLNGEHAGKVLFKYLGGQGAFKIIRDQHSGLWRVYRPRDPEDACRADQIREAPALIPSRYIDKIAWEKRAHGIPKIIKFTTGWQLWFYSSLANVPRGFQADGVWIDEELANPEWYREMRARIIDRNGALIWSATPQAGTEVLYDLVSRAEKGDLAVLDICMFTEDNPYLGESQVQAFAAGLTDQERRVRMHGEFLLSGLVVYPEFHRGGVHYEPYFPIPADWARYMAIDPGRQRCAVLFLAVPPPERGDTVYIYDEVYASNCDADLFGQEVAARSKQVSYEAMLIDMHAAGVVEMGSGQSVGDHYLAALNRYGVDCARGPGFIDGSGDHSIKAGIQAVRDWLRVRPNGRVKLKIMEEKCPHLCWEFERYRYQRDPKDGGIKESVEKRNDHLMDCLRYLAMYGPPYRRPKFKTAAESPAVRAMKLARKKDRDRNGPPTVGLGPRR